MTHHQMESRVADPGSPEDYAVLQRAVKERSGIDLSLYKPDQMRRRLWVIVQQAGSPSFTDYVMRIERDESAMSSLLDRMTINVSEMFRNAKQWEILQTEILQELCRQRHTVRVWSAGCANGAEVYSIAILLAKMAPIASHFILATDIDRVSLNQARQGLFSSDEIKGVAPPDLQRYFTPTGKNFLVNPWLVERITFQYHNLLSDPYLSGFNLIICRNVLIYFVETAKRFLYQRFSDALSAGGVLFLGGTEIIFRCEDVGLHQMYPGFYRREGHSLREI